MTTKENNNTRIRKKLQGVVISKKMQGTIKVRVERKFPHPLYKKIISKHKNYLAHCKDDKVVVGDKVLIAEGRPVSKRKKFYFIKKVVQ